jgi:soluble lytic murein transglycosylase-like protein
VTWEWVGQHGDPRDPKVDAVDWVECIPLAETRNFVQRVMENLQIYRARFGADVVTVSPICTARPRSNSMSRQSLE